jgi:hypothetical protein
MSLGLNYLRGKTSPKDLIPSLKDFNCPFLRNVESIHTWNYRIDM